MMSAKPSSGKIRIALILAAVAMVAGGYYLWSRRAPEVKWRTANVERGNVQVTVTSTGVLQAVVTVQVGTQVSGTIAGIYADFNSKVKKGQVVARIDSTLLVSAVSDAKSSLEKAEAQERQAADDLKRTQALFARALVSQSDLDVSTANARVAIANLSSAKAQVDRARINLRYATIVSPIDGIVLSRAVDVGQTVAASFNTPTLFTIAGDLRRMQVQASVDEADIGKIAVGQKATFTVDAYPDSVFSGVVQQIQLQPVTVQNVVTYNVLISVPNESLRLMPGMTASLTVVVAGKEDVLTAPAAALRFTPPDWDAKKRSGMKKNAGDKPGWAGKSGGQDSGRSASDTAAKGDGAKDHGRARGANDGRLFVLENGKPKLVHVKVGMTDGTHTEIEGSIEPGTAVITGIEATQANKAAAAPFGMQRAPGVGGPGGGGGGRGR